MLDVQKLNPAIKSVLVQRGHTEAQMREMSPREAFVEYCEWNGLVRWGDTLWEQAKALMEMPAPVLEGQASQPFHSPSFNQRLRPEAPKPDFAICVYGTPGHGWLSLPSDEDDDQDAVLVTEAPELVARYASYPEAQFVLERLVDAHPTRSFRVSPIDPLPGNPLLDAAKQAIKALDLATSHTVDHGDVLTDLIVAVRAVEQRQVVKDGDGFFYGTIKADRNEKSLLQSLGATLGDYNEKTGEFFAEVSPSSFERLKAFPADFQPTLHFYSYELVCSDLSQEEYSVEQLLAEKAYCEWWLNGPCRDERSVTKPTKIVDMEAALFQVNQVLATRNLQEASGQEVAPTKPSCSPSL